VEALGYLVFVALKYLNRQMGNVNRVTLKNFMKNFRKYFKFIVVCIGVLLILIWIGLTRTKMGDSSGVSLSLLIKRLFIQSTACDVSYVFNCSVELMNTNRLAHGYTYLSYLLNLIPFIDTGMDASSFIREYYFTVGGCPFFAEIIMNFGLYGVIPVLFLFFSFFNLILHKITNYRILFFIPIVLFTFRIAWYGWSGWIFLSVIVSPVLTFIITKISFVNNRNRILQKEN